MKPGRAPRVPALLCAVAALLAAPAPSSAQTTGARLEPQRSEIVFVTRQFGVPVEGRFGRFDAQVAIDAQQPEAGRVSLVVDVGSASLGLAEIDAELPKPVWFDRASFPQARFVSSSIRAVGPARFEVTGTLSIRGRTRELVVPVALERSAARDSVASGAFTLKRLDFGIGSGEWADTSVLADDVQVRFRFTFAGLGLP